MCKFVLLIMAKSLDAPRIVSGGVHICFKTVYSGESILHDSSYILHTVQ
jgi:hypothetical protein